MCHSFELPTGKNGNLRNDYTIANRESIRTIFRFTFENKKKTKKTINDKQHNNSYMRIQSYWIGFSIPVDFRLLQTHRRYTKSITARFPSLRTVHFDSPKVICSVVNWRPRCLIVKIRPTWGFSNGTGENSICPSRDIRKFCSTMISCGDKSICTFTFSNSIAMLTLAVGQPPISMWWECLSNVYSLVNGIGISQFNTNCSHDSSIAVMTCNSPAFHSNFHSGNLTSGDIWPDTYSGAIDDSIVVLFGTIRLALEPSFVTSFGRTVEARWAIIRSTIALSCSNWSIGNRNKFDGDSVGTRSRFRTIFASSGISNSFSGSVGSSECTSIFTVFGIDASFSIVFSETESAIRNVVLLSTGFTGGKFTVERWWALFRYGTRLPSIDRERYSASCRRNSNRMWRSASPLFVSNGIDRFNLNHLLEQFGRWTWHRRHFKHRKYWAGSGQSMLRCPLRWQLKHRGFRGWVAISVTPKKIPWITMNIRPRRGTNCTYNSAANIRIYFLALSVFQLCSISMSFDRKDNE